MEGELKLTSSYIKPLHFHGRKNKLKGSSCTHYSNFSINAADGAGTTNGGYDPDSTHKNPYYTGYKNERKFKDMEYKWTSTPKKLTSNQMASADDKMKPTLEVKTYDEDDEYTKIITPRQDVLFKKGYLTRRRIPESQPTEENGVENTENEEGSPYVNSEDGSSYVCAPGPYLDPSGMFFIGGGSYEVYDPYTGNVTVLLGPPPAVLTAVPCKPVPLQPVQWFNPSPANSAEWCCPYSTTPSVEKRFSADSQACSAVGSETSSGGPESLIEGTEIEDQSMMEVNATVATATGTIVPNAANTSPAPLYQQQYVYPGYMFGAPIYNMDGVNVQYCLPQNPPTLSNSNNELINSGKRRKKRKRRKRGGETEEEFDSSLEENCMPSESSSEYISELKTPDANIQLYNIAESGVNQLYNTKYTGQEFLTSTAILPYPAYTSYISPEITYFQSSELPLTVNDGQYEEINPATETNSEQSVQCGESFDGVNSINEDHRDSYTNNESSVSNKSKTISLNVHCKPFSNKESQFEDNHDKNELLEVGSSSSNSDSGISSPNSDASHVKELYESSNRYKNSNDSLTSNQPNLNNNGCNKQNKKSRSKKSKDGSKNKKPCDTYEITSIVEDFKKLSASQCDKNAKTKKVQFATDVTYSDLTDDTNERSQVRKRRRTHNKTKVAEESTKVKQNKKNKGNCKSQQNSKNSVKKIVSDEDEYVGRKDSGDEIELKENSSTTKYLDTLYENGASRCINNTEMIDSHNFGNGRKLKNTDANVRSKNECRKIISHNNKLLKHDILGSGPQTLSAQTALNVSPSSIERLNNCETNNKEWEKAIDKMNSSNEFICITKNPVLATLMDVNDLSDTTEDVITDDCSKFSSCREILQPQAPPRRKRSSQKIVEQMANIIVDDIIEEASRKVEIERQNTGKLPITEAVTKWLNEQGGLPVSNGVELDDEDFSDDNCTHKNTVFKSCIKCECDKNDDSSSEIYNKQMTNLKCDHETEMNDTKCDSTNIKKRNKKMVSPCVIS